MYLNESSSRKLKLARNHYRRPEESVGPIGRPFVFPREKSNWWSRVSFWFHAWEIRATSLVAWNSHFCRSLALFKGLNSKEMRNESGWSTPETDDWYKGPDPGAQPQQDCQDWLPRRRCLPLWFLESGLGHFESALAVNSVLMAPGHMYNAYYIILYIYIYLYVSACMAQCMHTHTNTYVYT